LPENSFDSWEELRQAFIDNFITTGEQPGNKYDLERIRDRKNEPLHDYIRCFSDMRLKIPKISHDEAISTVIKGLRFHEALRSKLLLRGQARLQSSSPQPKTTPMPMTQKNSSEKTSEESKKTSSLLDGTTPETTVDISTTAAFSAPTTETTEKGGTGAVTTVMISGVNDFATATTKSTQSSGLLVDVIIRRTTIKL